MITVDFEGHNSVSHKEDGVEQKIHTTQQYTLSNESGSNNVPIIYTSPPRSQPVTLEDEFPPYEVKKPEKKAETRRTSFSEKLNKRYNIHDMHFAGYRKYSLLITL